MKRYIGLDLGAENIKIVEIIEENAKKTLTRAKIVAHGKDPRGALQALLKDFDYDSIDGIAICGRLSRNANILRVPEKQSRAAGFRFMYDDKPVSIVSIGSHGFSVLELRADGTEILRENTRCSQGTGNFLMQLVGRFGLNIEQSSELCENIDTPAPLSGRCPVILKTDMTHLANSGQSHGNIIAGLYDAVCENVQVLLKPALCPPRILLTGGVTKSKRIQNRFSEFAERHQMEFIPFNEDAQFLDALGAAVLASQNALSRAPKFDKLFKSKVDKRIEMIPHIKRALTKVRRLPQKALPNASERKDSRLVLGYDMGSTGSKAVAIDADNGDLLWQAYVNTQGNPINAAQELSKQFLDSPWSRHSVVAAGVTGSGREIVGSLLTVCFGPEPVYVLNEIAAHAEGALSYDKRVDTIFEIGGQDAKYIRIDGGRVVDAAMNEACSAGTGSFIEEQGKLFSGVKDVKDLAEIALRAESACSLGQHCSVFMAEIIDEAIASGESNESIIAGIYDSIIQNYLNRVKGSRSVGSVIFCQGMPFSSDALAAAVARRTGSEVIVPPNPGTIGAQGIALLARRYRVLGKENLQKLALNRFLKAEITKKDHFICRSTKGCGGAGNKCRIDRISTLLEGKESKFTWGGGCSLYDKGSGRIKLPDLAPDPFREREALVDAIIDELPKNADAPRLAFTDEFTLKGLTPFFALFLAELGFKVEIHRHAEQVTLKRGIEEANIPFCAPMQMFHGVSTNIIETTPDILFKPMLLSTPAMKDEDRTILCPIVQAAPQMLQKDVLASKNRKNFAKIRFFSPVIDFQPGGLESKSFYKSCRHMANELASSLSTAPKNFEAAFTKALQAQKDFDCDCLELGDKAIAYCEEHKIPAVVVLGRPYTIYNKILNSNVPPILREQGAIAVPIDCFRIDDDVPMFKTMFWGYGQRNLRAAHQIRRSPNLYSIWCSNYACGPDSFVLHFYGYIMEGKPYAIIETDGHSGDAGTRTRVEAFLHCVREHSNKIESDEKATSFKAIEDYNTNLTELKARGDVVIIPRMGPGAEALAAALRGYGVEAEALPLPDHEALELGRKYTSGKECVPMCMTLGSLLQRVLKDTETRFTFFLPTGRGPCRFGVYNNLHKITMQRLGLDSRVRLWSPSDDNYFEGIPGGLAALAACSIVAADLLLAIRYDVRPAETEAGACDRIYTKYTEKLHALAAAAGGGDLSISRAGVEIASRSFYGILDLLKEAAIEFSKIRKPGALPTVLVTGEIYVRADDFTNDFTIDRLQALGIRVKLSPFYEWLDYQEYINTRVGIPHTLTSWLSAKAQNFIIDSLYKTVAKIMRWPALTRAATLIEKAEPYVRYQLEGEAGLTLGGAMHEWEHRQIDGVINLGPHECLPSKVAEAQFFHVAEESGLHSLSIHLNGDPVDSSVIEHFVYEVREKFQERVRKNQGELRPSNAVIDKSQVILKDFIRGFPKVLAK
ncbi:MAG: acyl-CoA dehydratase activase-related protein [Bradymonadales bacterium]|jgi:predicted CoA-substrate-specific enzyme activase